MDKMEKSEIREAVMLWHESGSESTFGWLREYSAGSPEIIGGVNKEQRELL